MHQYVAFPQRVADELKGLLEMRSHLVTRQVDRVYYLMVDLLGRRVADAQHSSRC